MKYLSVLVLFVFFLSNTLFSQTNEIVNPKKNWFFGAEIGLNKINSYSFGESKNSFQGGLLAEYYFARHWSLSGKIKYFKTGVSFYKPNTHSGGFFDLGSDESFGNFKGEVISIPLNLKWEFRIYKNLGGSLKFGIAANFETKSLYGAYSPNAKTDYPKQYGSIITGYGFNYFLNKQMALYLDIEVNSGAVKGTSDGFFGSNTYLTSNNLTNFGIKYNFKNQKKIK